MGVRQPRLVRAGRNAVTRQPVRRAASMIVA
jgi:hypothetical protein